MVQSHAESLFTACSTELESPSDVLALSFEKVSLLLTTGILLEVSAAGNIMLATYSAVRGKHR